jgi:hypothetical protein
MFLKEILREPLSAWTLVNADNGDVLATQVEIAADSLSRRRGLLGRKNLDNHQALILAPCNAVHTWFMRFSIDVIFVDRAGYVTRCCRQVRPWRFVAWRGFATIELAAGAIERSDTRRQQRLVLRQARLG